MSETELLGATPESLQRQNIMKEEFGWDVPVESIPLPSRGALYDPDSLLYNREALKIKAMTAHEEDILASAAFHKEGTAITHLLSSCITDKSIDPDDLILGDRVSLMIGIRVTGYGPSYNATATCTSCGSNNRFEANLTDLAIKRLKIKPTAEGKNEFEFVLPVTKKRVTFKYLTAREDRLRTQAAQNAAKVLRSKIDTTVTDFLESSITSIDGKTDRLKIKHFVKNMPAFDSRTLRNFIRENEPGIDMTAEFTCSSCGAANQVALPITTEFFWPST